MKIGVIAPNVTGESVKKGFNSINIDIIYKSFPFSKREQKSILKRAFSNIKNEQEKDFNTLILTIHEWLIPQNPDALIIVKGDQLNEKSAKILEKINFPISLWTTDSLSRFPHQNDLEQFSQYAFFHDGGDVSKQNHFWLPLGIDSDFYGIETKAKKWDILLTGNIKGNNYCIRRDFHNLIIKSKLRNKYKIGIASNISCLQRLTLIFKKNIYYLGRLPIKQYAIAISKSKICVNILQNDGIKPINPLFFAIPALGVIQVVNDLPYLNTWLKNDDTFEYFPVKMNNCIATIIQILESNITMKKNVITKTKNCHSYKQRILTILQKSKLI